VFQVRRVGGGWWRNIGICYGWFSVRRREGRYADGEEEKEGCESLHFEAGGCYGIKGVVVEDW
jgi:hypothetical protein